VIPWYGGRKWSVDRSAASDFKADPTGRLL
jgi:hypothetical protein